ncbi:MAG: hypothetical protein ACP5HZ_03000 [Ferrimicrobium sp.]|uniref:hypothetical protein n=1 Tax=Ferrimicrobium sp. TaxID=2926050 RepID=UPI002604EDE4|nr:hypothetical protein [Ferrimicrobium sp.]
MAARTNESSDRYETIETCNSLWVFEAQEKRFLRLPRSHPLPSSYSLLPESAWEHYESFTLDPVSGEFIVRLTADGSRVLRSQRHRQPCPICSAEADLTMTREISTIELSLLDGTPLQPGT